MVDIQSSAVLASSQVICSTSDIQESQRNLKNYDVNIEEPFIGELQKRGKQTSFWMTRYYGI